MKTFPRICLAAVIGLTGYWLFGQVLPSTASTSLAAVLAAAEIVDPILRRGTGGLGGGLRLFSRLGATLVSWPAFAWLLEYAGMTDRAARIAFAAAAASAAGLLAAGHGSGKDTARLWAIVAAVAVPGYAMMQTLLVQPADPLALAASSAAIVVALLVTRQSLIWPQEQSRLLLIATGFVLVSVTLAVGTYFYHV